MWGFIMADDRPCVWFEREDFVGNPQKFPIADIWTWYRMNTGNEELVRGSVLNKMMHVSRYKDEHWYVVNHGEVIKR